MNYCFKKRTVMLLVLFTMYLFSGCVSTQNNAPDTEGHVQSFDTEYIESTVPDTEAYVQSIDTENIKNFIPDAEEHVQSFDTEYIVNIVTLIANDREHKALENFHSFRSPCGLRAGGGGGSLPRGFKDDLQPILLTEDFQVVIEGVWHRRPRFYVSKLIGDRSVITMIVLYGNPYEVYLTYGRSLDERERIYANTLFGLLEPGIYIFMVTVSWGNEQAGYEGQHFFKLIIPAKK